MTVFCWVFCDTNGGKEKIISRGGAEGTERDLKDVCLNFSAISASPRELFVLLHGVQEVKVFGVKLVEQERD